jgi:DNA-binding NarL/FixJ family response regulator
MLISRRFIQLFWHTTARILSFASLWRLLSLALTEREKRILQLHVKGFSDYQIGLILRVDKGNVYPSHKNALRKLELARSDLQFFADLEAKSLVWKKR